jgi:hypothetical protein
VPSCLPPKIKTGSVRARSCAPDPPAGADHVPSGVSASPAVREHREGGWRPPGTQPGPARFPRNWAWSQAFLPRRPRVPLKPVVSALFPEKPKPRAARRPAGRGRPGPGGRAAVPREAEVSGRRGRGACPRRGGGAIPGLPGGSWLQGRRTRTPGGRGACQRRCKPSRPDCRGPGAKVARALVRAAGPKGASEEGPRAPGCRHSPRMQGCPDRCEAQPGDRRSRVGSAEQKGRKSTERETESEGGAWGRGFRAAPPPNQFKSLVQGRAAAERAAAVAAARLPAPEHAREPPRSPPPPRPRRPAPRRQVSGQVSQEAGGNVEGREGKGRAAGARQASQAVCGIAAATPLAPVGPTRAVPRARGSHRAAVLLLLPKPPRPGASPQHGQQAAAAGRTAGVGPASRAPLHAPSARPGGWILPASWKGLRGRERPIFQMSSLRLKGTAQAWRSALAPRGPIAPHLPSSAHCPSPPHQRTPGRYGPPLRLAPRVGW